MIKLVKKLKESKFWVSVGVLTSGTAIAQSIGILTTPLVSRIYSPGDYGEYALLLSASTIIIGIVTLGLSSAIMVPKDDEKSKEVFMVVFILSGILASVIYITSNIFANHLTFIKTNMDIHVFLLLLYLSVLVNCIKGYLTILVNKFALNRLLFNNSLIGALSTLIISIPLGILGFTMYGLIIASIIGGILSIVQMLNKVNPFIKSFKFSIIKKVLGEYKKFVIYQYPSNAVETLAAQLPAQFFSTNFGSSNLGGYSMNEKLLGLPLRLIGAPINTIYFRTATEYYNSGKDLSRFTFSLITKIMLLSLVPSILIILWGEYLFAIFLGENWSIAGEIAKYLIVFYVFMFCSTITSYLRVSIGKQSINLLISILRLFIVFITLFIGFYSYNNFYSVMKIYVIGMSIYYIIDMMINFILLKKYAIQYVVISSLYLIITLLLWML